MFGTNGTEKLKEYLAKGGIIYASSKAGYLLEVMGLVSSGTYNTDNLLTTLNTNSKVGVIGCENQSANDPATADFSKQILCFSRIQSLVNSKNYTYNSLLGSYMLNQLPDGFDTLYSFDGDFADLRIRNTFSGLDSVLKGNDKKLLPMLLLKNYEKGKIIINHANPTLFSDYYHFFYNMIFLAMARPVILDTFVGFGTENKPIPGGNGFISKMLIFSLIYRRGWRCFGSRNYLHEFLREKYHQFRFAIVFP